MPVLDSFSYNKLKPLIDLIDKKSPNNVNYGYVSEILKDSNLEIIGYTVKIGSESLDIYDTSQAPKVRDLVTVSVTKNSGIKLSTILNTFPHRVDITTVNLGIDAG